MAITTSHARLRNAPTVLPIAAPVAHIDPHGSCNYDHVYITYPRSARRTVTSSSANRMNAPEGSDSPVLVSACMLGVRCRYDASTNPSDELLQKVSGARIVPVCPEQLGGLTTPRPAAHLQGGSGEDVLDGRARVVTEAGADVTEQYVRGAAETLRIARLFGVCRAILKERSPSCGCAQVHRDGALRPGSGVTAALLRREGITVEPLDPPKKL